jgi:hypothetical protein
MKSWHSNLPDLWREERTVEGAGGAHQETIISMLVQEDHTRLKRNRNLLARRLTIVWVKDRLPADTALGRGSQIEEKGPRRADGERGLRGKSKIIVVVICVRGQMG